MSPRLLSHLTRITLPILVGCASLFDLARNPFEWDRNYLYQHNVHIRAETAQGEKFETNEGILVLPQGKGPYKLKFEAIQQMDSVFLRTCGGVKHLEPRDDGFKYTYTPNDVDLDCANLLQITGFEQNLNRPTFGLIIFADTTRFTLPATINCNLEKKEDTGTGFCHTSTGSEARIEFPSPTKLFTHQDECRFTTLNEGRRFDLKPTPEKPCEIQFVEQIAPFRRFDFYLRPFKFHVSMGEKHE